MHQIEEFQPSLRSKPPWFDPLVKVCSSCSVEEVKSLHEVVQFSKDPLRSMISTAARHNRVDISDCFVRVGAPIDINSLELSYDLAEGKAFETLKFLVEKGLDINESIEIDWDFLITCVADIILLGSATT